MSPRSIGRDRATAVVPAHSKGQTSRPRARGLRRQAECLQTNRIVTGVALVQVGERREKTLMAIAEPFDNTPADGYLGHLDEQFLSGFPTWIRGTP